MTGNHMGRIGWAAVVFSCLLAAVPSRLSASGSDYSHRTKDLTLTVDPRWAGGRHGGYLPVRIRVKNTGKERELLFRFSPAPHIKLPDVRKRVAVGQNVTRQFTLSIPLVSDSSHGSYGELSVWDNGRPIKEFTETISLPDWGGDEINCPSLLVISSKKIDCEQFSIAANSLYTSAYSRLSGGYGVSRTEDYEVIEPVMLPDSAVDYSALDVLALSLETLGKLPEETRAAIVNWVRTGGKLIIYETGAPAAEVKAWPSLLPFQGTGGWKASDTTYRRPIHIVSEEELRHGMEVYIGGSGAVTSIPEEDSSQQRYVWNAKSETFAAHPLMLGHVIAFPKNPFPGSPHDWAWLFKSVRPDTWRWTTRQGISTRQADQSFMEFTIPGVGGVPKIAFIVLISGFTIVIGPLNYFLLRRRRQLYLLVVTIPAIAFLTSCSLFAYAAIADGFGVTSRARSYTLLDQRHKTAVSLSRFALYAGVAPSAGLQFSPETAVYPLWPAGQDAPQGRWDWTGGQHLTSGWIRSRTPAQFMTVSQRTERGRVEITPGSTTETIQAANGLEWAIETILVVDEKGDLYQGSDLPAGRSAELTRVKPRDAMKRLSEIYKKHPLNMNGHTPINVTQEPTAASSISTMIYSQEARTEVKYSAGLLENRLKQLLEPRKAQDITSQRRTYLAILRENPGLQWGVEGTSAEGDFHVLQGMY